MKTIYFLICLFILTPAIQSQIVNEDKPLKGKWDFKLTKLGEIEEADGDVFATIGTILSDDEENLYLGDRKRFKIFIFDKNGKFISSFGKKGEGPGEIKRLGRFFLAGNQLILPDRSANKVLYFSKKGKFLKSVVVPIRLYPRAMIDENRMLSVPWINWQDPKAKTEAIIYNIKDKTKKVVFRFSTFRKGVVQKTSGSNTSTFSFSNSAVTPVMIQAFHNNKIYYGMNDTYRITVKDLDLKTVVDFSLEREKTKVPDAFKKEVVKELNFPDSVKLEMKKGLPDHFTYFQGIFADANENIYVYVTDPGQGKLNSRKLDIFSPVGKYIYSAEIVIEEGLYIQGSHLKKDKLYLEVENEDGDLKVVKYKIRLPGQAGGG